MSIHFNSFQFISIHFTSFQSFRLNSIDFILFQLSLSQDSRDESLSSQLSTAFSFLDEVQRENGRCLVHCRMGASRSVSA